MSSLGRVLIFGAGGQLGTELQRSLSGAGELVCLDRDTIDLANEQQLRAAIRRIEPNLILNAAAYTTVDRAESEVELATAINATAPRILAEEAGRLNILLVHYSTDYVFDGSKQQPWVEDDRPNPLNVYGASKLAGEQAVQQAGGKHLIFRTSWVYGPHGANFLLTMLRLGRERDTLRIVDDQIGAPTTSIELANATRSVVDAIASGQHGSAEHWAGLYHMTCGGSVSWCGFARAIFARAASLQGLRPPQIVPIPSAEYPTPARRPLNSLLSNDKLSAQLHVRLPHWEAALDAAFAALAAPSAKNA